MSYLQHPSLPQRARTSARAALIILVGFGLSVATPVGQVESWASPVTLDATLEDLPVATEQPLDLDALVAAQDAAQDAASNAAQQGVGLAGIAAKADEDGTDDTDGTDGTDGTDDTEVVDVTDATLPITSTTEPIETPLTVTALGVVAPEGTLAVQARSSADGQTWTDWEPVEFLDEEDGPDPGTAEARDGDAAVPTGRASALLWVGEATHLQFRVDGADASDLEVSVIDSMGASGGPVQRHTSTRLAEASADGLTMVSRAAWGADESLRNGDAKIAHQVSLGVVHHTAHTTGSKANTYSAAEAPGIMRAMYSYHTQRLGWQDLGYNVVVDRFGTVYEGRAGGFDRGVIGAHAAGFNTGSFGVSVIGNFLDATPPQAAIDALVQVIGTKSAVHGIDPTGWTNQMADGAWRPTIVGHRDVGRTSCPGRIHGFLPDIRERSTGFSVRFPDVPSSSPHRTAILELADAGVTTGCTVNNFCPSSTLNRAQASSFVVRALELTPIPGSQFPDVPADGAHAPAINVLVDRGWLIGYEDGLFRPWEPMTRGQLATLLARSMELPLDTPWVDPYPDVSRTSTHAPGIAALAEQGIRGDCGSGRFCANDMVLRDSTASFVNMVRDVLFPPSVIGEDDDSTGSRTVTNPNATTTTDTTIQ